MGKGSDEKETSTEIKKTPKTPKTIKTPTPPTTPTFDQMIYGEVPKVQKQQDNNSCCSCR